MSVLTCIKETTTKLFNSSLAYVFTPQNGHKMRTPQFYTMQRSKEAFSGKVILIEVTERGQCIETSKEGFLLTSSFRKTAK